MPLAWRINSVAPSKYPPTPPPFARNSSMIPAFQSLGSGMPTSPVLDHQGTTAGVDGRS